MARDAWNYTAAERRTIDAAYSAVAYIVDHMGHGEPWALRDALRHERRERSGVTVAKALLVSAFADGRRRNPRATELAGLSAGIMRAAILGASSRRLDKLERGGSIGETLRELPKLAAAAAAAHDDRQHRGMARVFSG